MSPNLVFHLLEKLLPTLGCGMAVTVISIASNALSFDNTLHVTVAVNLVDTLRCINVK